VICATSRFSSIRVRRISSVSVSTRMFPPSFFGHANRGLLAEANALEDAGASPATGTSEEVCVSACSHAADERCEMAERRTDLVRWGGRKRADM
jgi:hypothetical protein